MTKQKVKNHCIYWGIVQNLKENVNLTPKVLDLKKNCKKILKGENLQKKPVQNKGDVFVWS